MAKIVIYSKEARERMLAGIDTLADVVKITLGPKGRNVVVEKSYGAPMIINDGVTIAREIELEDKFEDMGAKLVLEVANKTAPSVFLNFSSSAERGAEPCSSTGYGMRFRTRSHWSFIWL